MDFVTKVSFTKTFNKQLLRSPDYIQKKVATWIIHVELLGLIAATRSSGMHDEPLLGTRWGQRSIRLNKSYRLIYRKLEGHVHIELLEVHKHEY